jgi:hypothetical protein
MAVFDPIPTLAADERLSSMISDARNDAGRENVVMTRTPARRATDDRGES